MSEYISWALCAVGVVVWLWVEIKCKGDKDDS